MAIAVRFYEFCTWSFAGLCLGELETNVLGRFDLTSSHLLYQRQHPHHLSLSAASQPKISLILKDSLFPYTVPGKPRIHQYSFKLIAKSPSQSAKQDKHLSSSLFSWLLPSLAMEASLPLQRSPPDSRTVSCRCRETVPSLPSFLV